MDSLKSLLSEAAGVERAELLNRLSEENIYINNEQSLEYAKEALSVSIETGDRYEEADSYTNIGYNYYEIGDYYTALENYLQSLKIFESLNDSLNIQGALNNVSIAYMRLGDYDNALAVQLRSQKICDKLELNGKSASSFHNLGCIYLYLQDYEKSLVYLLRTYELKKDGPQTETMGSILYNIGVNYHYLGEYDKALEYYKKSNKIRKSIGQKLGIADCLMAIGHVYKEKKDYGRASANYKNALDIFITLNNNFYVCYAYASIGEVNILNKNYDEAEHYLTKADQLAGFHAGIDLHKEIHLLFSDLYNAQEDYKNAFDSFKEYTALKDSLFSESQGRYIADLEAEYESEKKEKENELLRRNGEIQRLAIEKETSLRNLFIAISVFFILMIFLIYRGFNQKRKANIELSQKNDMITIQQDKLNHTLQELKKTNITKDKFFSIIAHDLKGPFNTILGFAEILDTSYEEYTDDERKEMIGLLTSTSKKGFLMVENLLNWARSQRKMIKIEKEDLNLRKLAEGSLSLVSGTAQLKNIEIENLIDPGILLYSDRRTISTVIRNLVYNAIKFTHPGGKISVSGKVIDDSVEVSVADTGIGMSEEQANSLFKIHETYSIKGTNDEMGTGLGLIICKEFIELNDGDIRVESKAGEGSTFIFSLPTAKSIEMLETTLSSIKNNQDI